MSDVAQGAVVEQAIPQGVESRNWLRNRAFDFLFILGSVVLIFLIIGIYYTIRPGTTSLVQQGNFAQLINLIVPLLLGGPHIWMSFTRTFMDPEFRMSFPRMMKIAPHAIGLMVLYLLFMTYMKRGDGVTILMNIVFFSAVFHGLSQLAHIAIKYRKNAGERMTWPGAVTDAALIFGGPTAFVLYSIKNKDYFFVDCAITKAFSTWPIIYFFAGMFALAAVSYLVETIREIARGRFNWQKLVIIVSTQVGFVVLAELSNADITFQAYNAWHSFQALGLMWAVQNSRYRQGKLFGTAKKLSADGKFLLCYVYGCVFAASIGLAVVLLSGSMKNIPVSPWYFLIAITVLLIHHYFDYFLFFRKKGFEY